MKKFDKRGDINLVIKLVKRIKELTTKNHEYYDGLSLGQDKGLDLMLISKISEGDSKIKKIQGNIKFLMLSFTDSDNLIDKLFENLDNDYDMTDKEFSLEYLDLLKDFPYENDYFEENELDGKLRRMSIMSDLYEDEVIKANDIFTSRLYSDEYLKNIEVDARKILDKFKFNDYYIKLSDFTKLKNGSSWNNLTDLAEFDTLNYLVSLSTVFGYIDNTAFDRHLLFTSIGDSINPIYKAYKDLSNGILINEHSWTGAVKELSDKIKFVTSKNKKNKVAEKVI